MRTQDFHFSLPPRLIAQHPAHQRDACRLLHLDRRTGAVEHRVFTDLPALLRPEDCLVRNNTKVLPARLTGNRILRDGTRSTAACEVLLLKDKGGDVWEALCRPGKKLPVGARVMFGDGRLSCEIAELLSDGRRLVRFFYSGIFIEQLTALGEMPLPPYITEKSADPEQYQTIYAKKQGSAAAPTAGLHFTEALFDQIRAKGVAVVDLTLHVGLGTFRPVKTARAEDHIMHSEDYDLPAATVRTIEERRAAGGRVIAVGTTSVRVLESAVDQAGNLRPGSGSTNIFITPGYVFRQVDGLVTNFHLPESTLVMLVSAFAGREAVLAAYNQAVQAEYRFFSFGDAMVVL